MDRNLNLKDKTSKVEDNIIKVADRTSEMEDIKVKNGYKFKCRG